MKPMVIRINDVGRAEAIDYRNYQYKPEEAENKYYLARWATLYFQRNRYSIEQDQTASLYFLNSDVQRAVIQQEQQEKTISTFQHDTTLPYVDIDVKSIVLEDLQKSPYSARIEFEKAYTNPGDHSVLKKERWIATVTYVFADKVANDALSVNPLGLTIIRYRADQAFN
jgi:type IV secretion system protein VirB5